MAFVLKGGVLPTCSHHCNSRAHAPSKLRHANPLLFSNRHHTIRSTVQGETRSLSSNSSTDTIVARSTNVNSSDVPLPSPTSAISSGTGSTGTLSDLGDGLAGGCLANWLEDSGFWDNPSPVRAALFEVDPGLNQSLISSATSVAQIFDQDAWERHRKSDRYLTYMKRFLHSTVLRRSMQPCMMVTAIALMVCIINTFSPASWPRVSMSMVPHTLLGAALSLLLVFRTNSSYARFTEGRALWGALVRHSRDWTRLAAAYFPSDLRKRAARYVQVLAFVLKSHLRQGRTRKDPKDPTAFRDDPTHVVHELLPCGEATAVLQQQNPPFFVVCRMTQLAKEASSQIPEHVAQTLEHSLSELLMVLGGCDRILGTPIPLSYTRHTSRSLLMWLSTLPLGLWPANGWLTVPVTFVIAFIFIGIDEIGIQIEEPFCMLPLLPMCRTVTRDVDLAMNMSPVCVPTS